MKKNQPNNKKTKPLRVVIVYFSPSGSTRKVAETYQEAFQKQGDSVQMLDLTRNKDLFETHHSTQVLQHIEPHDLLLAGGPIYIDHMQYNLLDFLYLLPFVDHQKWGAYGGVFSTFGKVSRGVGLAEASSILSRKGRHVVSALEVDAPHCATRTTDRPINPDLPGEELSYWVHESVQSITESIRKKAQGSLDLILSQAYNTYPQIRPEKDVLQAFPVVTFDRDLCIGCGLCIKACPTLDLYMVRSLPTHLQPSQCIHCTNCLSVCPQGAVNLPLTERSHFVHAKLKQQKLDPLGPSLTQLYLLG